MKKRYWLALGLVVIVLAAGVAFIMARDALIPQKSKTEETVAPTTSLSKREQLAPLVQALNSTERQKQAEAFTVLVREPMLATSEPFLPPGSTVMLDEESFSEYEPGYASVQCAITISGKVENYNFQLAKEDGRWRILTTTLRK